MDKIKKYFLTGLLIWLPICVTLWIIEFIIQVINKFVPSNLSNNIFGIYIPGSGIVVAVLIVFVTGALATNFIGQKLVRFGNKIILHIPIVKSIYKGVKQFSDTLLSSNSKAFRKAILVRFPNNTTWTIAFITGYPGPNISDHLSDGYINVYVPTTPNPTSGYFLIVHTQDTLELNMSVEQAMRYVISMGSINLNNNIGKSNDATN